MSVEKVRGTKKILLPVMVIVTMLAIMTVIACSNVGEPASPAGTTTTVDPMAQIYPTMYIKGSMNDWGNSEEPTPMTYTDTHIWEVTIDLTQNYYEYKFCVQETTWSNNWGDNDYLDWNVDYVTGVGDNNGTNIPLVSKGGQVHFRFNESTQAFLMDGSIDIIDEEGFRKNPYLIYPEDNTKMKICWQAYSEQTSDVTLYWGPNTGYGNDIVVTPGSDNLYAKTITGLIEGSRTYFKVSMDNADATGDFYAAPAESATNLNLYIYGDTRSNPMLHDLVTKQMLTDIDASSDRQSLILFSGDWVNSGSKESNWDFQFFSPFTPWVQALQARMPIMGCRGNHEDGSDHLMKKYYTYQYEEAGGDASYYSFDYGPVHVVMIDICESYIPGSAQYTWLQSDLAATSKAWKIVVFHSPGWSANGTAASPGKHPNNLDVQRYLQPLFESNNVRLIFNGDNHYYSRVRVKNAADTFHNYHITTGGGGAPLYIPDAGYSSNYNSAYTGIMQATSSNRHFCRLEITGSSADVFVVTEDGLVVDTFSVGL